MRNPETVFPESPLDRIALLLCCASGLAGLTAAALGAPVGLLIAVLQIALLWRLLARRRPPPAEQPAALPEAPPPLAPPVAASLPAPDRLGFFDRLRRGDFTARLPAADANPETIGANAAAAQIQTAVDEALALSELMAGGDLSTRASGQYDGALKDLTSALNTVQDGLRRMLTTALGAATDVTDQSAALAGAMATVRTRMDSQARVVADVAAAMETMAGAVAAIRRTTEGSAAATAATGKVVTESQVATEAAQTALARMQTDAQAIGGILGTIEMLAQQTNVLAINASIEAARAGEAGRGFAVVSDEVRALAARSGDAARQIRAIVNSTGASVEECSKQVNACSDLIHGIVARIADVQALSGDIAKACAAQDSVLDRTGAAVHTLDEHERATTVEVGAVVDLAGRLDGVAGRLRADLDRFRLSDDTMVEAVIARAEEIARRFETALASGRITLDDLFSRSYTRIEGVEPPQFMAPFTRLTDEIFPDILEGALQVHEGVVFSAAVCEDGYLPTHNRKFSQPPRMGDTVWNAANARNRRFFDDRVGLAAGRSQAPFLIQSYRRDMGGGAYVTMKDISAPIRVRGRHWGGLRIGYRPTLATAEDRPRQVA